MCGRSTSFRQTLMYALALQAFALGSKLRKQYLDTSGQTSVPRSAVQAFSTDYDRTVDTARALLLGLFSEPASQPSGGGVTAPALPGHCECRQDHGVRSPTACIAKCLRLKSPPLKHVPDVQVRKKNDDVAMLQAQLCSGWSEWVQQMKTRAVWRDAPHGKLESVAHMVDRLAGDKPLVQAWQWPEKVCAKCVNRTAPDFDQVGFFESVRTATPSSWRCTGIHLSAEPAHVHGLALR
jgi:hypothetical protein